MRIADVRVTETVDYAIDVELTPELLEAVAKHAECPVEDLTDNDVRDWLMEDAENQTIIDRLGNDAVTGIQDRSIGPITFRDEED